MLMTAPLSDHLLNVADLVERPGASREVDLGLAVPDDFDMPLASVYEPVRLVGVIESVVDGLLVRGALRATLGLSCARCLQPVSRDVHIDAVELYMDPAQLDDDDEEVEPGYELADGYLHLGALLRDGLSAAIPYRPLCREDCLGLCADCGADRNETPCDCAEQATDPRWESLRDLRLPDSRS